MKRPLYPSCVIPGLLYLGDLADAAALPRLREHLNVTHTITALAELTPSLTASVHSQDPNHLPHGSVAPPDCKVGAHGNRLFGPLPCA